MENIDKLFKTQSGRPAGMCFESLPMRLRAVPGAVVTKVCPADCLVSEVRWDGELAVLSERDAGHRCRGGRNAPRPAFQRDGVPAHRRSAGWFGVTPGGTDDRFLSSVTQPSFCEG